MTDVPILIICYNNHRYIDNMVRQLSDLNNLYRDNLVIVDNRSTDQETLDYLKKTKVKVYRRSQNNGPWISKRTNPDLFDSLPDLFVITDPDLQLNQNTPKDFIETLIQISRSRKCNRVGLALKLGDDTMIKSVYYDGKDIDQWESRFWNEKIEDPNYELYRADIDTTFVLINKDPGRSPDTRDHYNHDDIRVAGDFTCRHLPWYIDDTIHTVYQRYNLYIDASYSTTKKMYNSYIKENYHIIYKNDTSLLIPFVDDPFDPSLNKPRRNDPNLNFWIGIFPQWESDTFQVFDKVLSPDKVMIDIGGWIGTTCIYGSRKSKHVYVVEADPNSVRDLRLNCKINCTNVTVIDRPIYHKDDVEVSFGPNKFRKDSKWNDSTSQITGVDVYTDSHNGINMRTVTLQKIIDDNKIDPKQISLVKVDIEGGEQHLLHDLYQLKEKYPTIKLYISFHHDWWTDKDLAPYKILTDYYKSMIWQQPFCSILF